jgi:hypothetical protein
MSALARSWRAVLLVLALGLSARAARAQSDTLDDRLVVLTYHKLTGQPLDFRAAAERSEAVLRASGFDRPDVLNAEAAKLQHDLAAADPSHEFVLRVNDNISEYDHDKGQFAVTLFKPGFYIPVDAFHQQYQLVFANAAQASAIAMPKDSARIFDAKLNANNRGVTDEIRFRVIGAGDPAGAVTGPRVIRGEILSVRMLDRAGNVVFAPKIGAAGAPRVAANGPSTGRSAATDVAGLHVGMRAKELEPTLVRLFGHVTREERSKSWFPGFKGALVVNDMKCIEMPGRGRAPEPGTVCVTAFLDGDDVVRSIRVERVFAYVDAETFRATLVRKYGPVTEAKETGTYSLGWGAPVEATLVYDQTGPHTAVAAYYEANDDMFSRGMNSLPRIRVVLQLVDAAWAASHPK